MPGSTPATSQLDWLSSTTAMIGLSLSKAARALLKSFSWGIGALRQLFASDDGAISFAACPIPSLRWRETDSNLRFPDRSAPVFETASRFFHHGFDGLANRNRKFESISKKPPFRRVIP